MAKVVGYDEQVIKQYRVTCRSCGAIIEYIKTEIKERTYTCMGDPSGHTYVECPACGEDARIRSW